MPGFPDHIITCFPLITTSFLRNLEERTIDMGRFKYQLYTEKTYRINLINTLI